MCASKKLQHFLVLNFRIIFLVIFIICYFTDGLNTDLHLDIGNGVSLEKVDKLCYLGDMLDADGGCDSAVTARVRCAWKKFREYLPILTGKGFS